MSKRRIHWLPLVLVWVALWGCHAERTGPRAVRESSDYLPLTIGARWVLRSRSVPTPIVLEVSGRSAEDYELRFENPWMASALALRPAGGAVLATSVSMGGGRASMPPGTVYFDFNAGEGQQWTNRIGTMTLISGNQKVITGDRVYSDCIEIREVNSNGQPLFWFFAPKVGFVQFGEGPAAFVLDAGASRLPGPGSAPADGRRPGTGPAEGAAAPGPQPSGGADGSNGSNRSDGSNGPNGTRASKGLNGSEGSRRSEGSGGALIALAANPPGVEGYTPRAVSARFDQAVRAGVTYVYLSPRWNEIESQRGRYNFNDIDLQVREAERYNLPIVCNLRILDTNQRAMPEDLKSRSMRDRELEDRLVAVLAALMPHLKGRARYMLIGNEIDGYFRQHRAEVDDYADLFGRAASSLRQAQPGLKASASITFDGISGAESLLRPVLAQTGFFAVTYYPLHPDFTVRDPQDVPSDFARILRAANGKPILLEEIGYPSSPANNSSEDRQAALFRSVFEQLRIHGDDFIGAYFFLLSDLPDSTVDELARYYSLPNAGRFKAFLRSLGMLDDQGRPKKSWAVFEEEASRERR